MWLHAISIRGRLAGLTTSPPNPVSFPSAKPFLTGIEHHRSRSPQVTLGLFVLIASGDIVQAACPTWRLLVYHGLGIFRHLLLGEKRR